MNKILNILGIALVVLSILLLIAVPPAGVAGIVFGILCIAKSKKKTIDKINTWLSKSIEKSKQQEKLYKEKLESLKKRVEIFQADYRERTAETRGMPAETDVKMERGIAEIKSLKADNIKPDELLSAIKQLVKKVYAEKQAIKENLKPSDTSPFSMVVAEDVFTIHGIGTVVTGKIQTGSIELNEKITIIGGEQYQDAIVITIEKSSKLGKLVCSVNAGDYVRLLLNKINGIKIKKGYVIARKSDDMVYTELFPRNELENNIPSTEELKPIISDIKSSPLESKTNDKTFDLVLFQSSDFIIHDDIKNLLWIADGKYKNYIQGQKAPDFEYCRMRVYITIGTEEEPSLIYSKQPIRKPLDETVIPRPPYYPTYAGLTPEQRYIYAKLLSNPYNSEIDIGYIFILYYGLERHLLCGDFDAAFKVILKLRDVHRNGSFQSYSANALILSSMLHKKGEYVLDFIASLDKEYEFNFSSNLFLISYYSFNLPLLPKDITRMASIFEFTNKNYIKKNPAIFEQRLSEIINSKYGSEGVFVNRFITKTELSRIKMDNSRLFANMSLLDKEISVPMLSENFRLKKEMNDLLVEAHEQTKKLLAAMRKKGANHPNGQSSEIGKVMYTDIYLMKPMIKRLILILSLMKT
jgi:hypothetical protein